MSFFTGEYACKVDAKGRMVLPARVKGKLPEAETQQVMLVRGFEPCLVLYPLIEWRKVYSKVVGLNEFNEEYRRFQRSFFRGQAEADLDGNGRFLIPKHLLDYAGINGEVTAVGMGNRVELWSPDRYEEALLSDGNEMAQMAEKLLAPQPQPHPKA